MFQSRSDYDRGVNTFSPEGRIYQIEYAISAIKHGYTAIGIQTAEGVVLGAEHRLHSPLMLPESLQKMQEIDEHMGCVMSGLTADARTLIEHARVQSQDHRFTYNEPMRVEACAVSICDLSMGFGEGKKLMSRPFGVSLLIAGVDDNGPCLWHTDPAGTFLQFSAKAIGQGSDSAQTILQEKYHKSMTLDDAKKLVVSILKEVMEEKLTTTNVELAVAANNKFTTLPKEAVEELIQAV